MTDEIDGGLEAENALLRAALAICKELTDSARLVVGQDSAAQCVDERKLYMAKGVIREALAGGGVDRETTNGSGGL